MYTAYWKNTNVFVVQTFLHDFNVQLLIARENNSHACRVKLKVSSVDEP